MHLFDISGGGATQVGLHPDHPGRHLRVERLSQSAIEGIEDSILLELSKCSHIYERYYTQRQNSQNYHDITLKDSFKTAVY